MFTKGQYVVCINDDFPPEIVAVYHRLPVKDEVYTIRAVYVGCGKYVSGKLGGSDGEIGVLLQELDNSGVKRTNRYDNEPGFNAERFVPLEEAGEDEQMGKEEERMATATAG